MFWKARPLTPLIALTIALTTLLAVPAGAAPMTPIGTTPIDDALEGDPAAPGVNIIRNVSAGEVIVRLNEGFRQAHFTVIVQNVDVTAIDDDFPLAHGVDGGHEDGVWGGCSDELLTNTDSPRVAEAKFYTCSQHDSIRIHLGEIESECMVTPAIRIVFRDRVLDNVEGVYVGDDPTDVGSNWVPLFE